MGSGLSQCPLVEYGVAANNRNKLPPSLADLRLAASVPRVAYRFSIAGPPSGKFAAEPVPKVV